MGVSLLANSQLGTFYPPNWLTIGLAPPDAVRISILLHALWMLAGTYLLARRAVSLDPLPAFLAAVVFAFGGYALAHVEQINQFQGLAWMPWLFLLLSTALERPLPATLFLGMGLALQFLSGHTQTLFITVVGLVLYGLLARRWRFVLLLGVAGLLALLLAAPQWIPTFELSEVSNRRGGLTQNQATAFSFSPFALGRGLLPGYDQPIFGEYTAYIGLIGLGLAIVGLLARQPARTVSREMASAPPRQIDLPEGFTLITDAAAEPPDAGQHRAWWAWSASPRLIWGGLALAGLLLALGLYNPLYWWLASLPGFNLFRVPARWLALLALGGAMLAGLGLEALRKSPPRRRTVGLAVIAVALGLAGWSFLATRAVEGVPLSNPAPITLIGWAVALAGFFILLWLDGWLHARSATSSVTCFLCSAVRLALVGAAVAELWLAAQTLPYNDLTTPDAYRAPRFTINQLRAYQEGRTPPGRILSISNLYFDPGDRAALEARYATMGLSAEAVRAAFIAIKMKEALVPNLPLIWGIPTIDGFDGGLLPTAYYTAFASLLLPDGTLRTLDGRLYEILARERCRGACLPDHRWLSLTNTQYLITDKVFDLWVADVAYDTQFSRLVTSYDTLTVNDLPEFEATALDILYRCEAVNCPPPAAAWTTATGDVVPLEPMIDEAPSVDGFQLARLSAPGAQTAERLEVASITSVTVQALTLVDTRTGDFVQLAPDPWRRVLSSDIKLYENGAVMPRAFVVHDIWTTADTEAGTEAALDIMRDPSFDPARAVVLAGAADAPVRHEEMLGEGGSQAVVTSYSAERVSVQVDAASEGVLVLTDAYYPGWSVSVNGEEATLLRADVMFRGVRVPAGESEVIFEYRPAWWPAALLIGAGGWLALVVGLAVLWGVRRRARPAPING